MRNAESAVLDGKLQSLRAEGQIETALNKTAEAGEKNAKAAKKREEDILASRESLSAKLQTINQSDADFQSQMEDDLVQKKEQANREKLAAEEEYQAALHQLDLEAFAMKTDLYGRLFGAISRLFRKNTLAYKASAVAEATMATFSGVAQEWGTSDPVWMKFVKAAIILANGLAAVTQIKNVQYSSGGYTGQGDKYAPRGVVHAGEYVVSSDELARPEVRSFVGSVVEPMRMKRLGYSSYAQSTTMPGYANGGFTGSGSSAQVMAGNEELKTMLSANLAVMNFLLQNGVNANFDESKIKEMRDRVRKQEAMDARAKT
jgi:hypothetical protein